MITSKITYWTRIYVHQIVFVSIWFITSCSEDPVRTLQIDGDDIDFLRAIDVRNTNTASDILVQFILSSESSAQELRIILNKASNLSSENSSEPTISEFTPYFKRAAVPGKPYRFQLDRNLTDLDNDLIVNNVNYQVLVALVSKDGTVRLSKHKTFVRLTDKHPLEGQYKGVWGDDVDGSIPVSLSLRHSNGFLFGSFYFTNIYEPCCSAVEDGRVQMTILPGGRIDDFRFEQRLEEFNNGIPCNGVFFGEGEVLDFTRIDITYTGTDCLGQHFGRLIIDRQ